MSDSLANDELEKILNLQTELASAKPDVYSLMMLITRRTRELIGCDGVVFELKEGDELVYRAISGMGESQIGLRIPMKGSFSGLCMETRTAMTCLDSELDARVNLNVCRRIGLRSMVVQPLYFEGEVIGVLKAYSSRESSFTAHNASFLRLISGSMAATLFNAYKWAESEKHIKSLAYHASHDSMTGLKNRSAFFDQLRMGVESAKKFNTKFALGMTDLDGLKYVNDTFGHAAGDFLISKFAERLETESGSEAIVARLGGDEFAMLIAKTERGKSLNKSFYKIVARAEGVLPYENQFLSLRASAGVAVFPDDCKEPEKLMELADERLYENKKTRRSKT